MEIIRLPKKIRGLVLDMDRTLYPYSPEQGQPYLAEGTQGEWVFLACALGKSIADVQRAADDKREEIELRTGRKTSLTSAVIALGVKKQAWDAARGECYFPWRHLQRNLRLRYALSKTVRRVPACVFSNSPRVVALRVLSAIGIDDLGVRVFGADDVLTFKPDPAAFLAAATAAGVPKEGLVSIGDRRDIDCLVPLEAGYGGAVHVNGPDDVIEFLDRHVTKSR